MSRKARTTAAAAIGAVLVLAFVTACKAGTSASASPATPTSSASLQWATAAQARTAVASVNALKPLAEAASSCIDGIKAAAADETIKKVLENLSDKAGAVYVVAHIAGGSLRVEYRLQNGQILNATFDFARVIFAMLGQVPGFRLFGILGQPAIDCTEAAFWYDGQLGGQLGRLLRSRLPSILQVETIMVPAKAQNGVPAGVGLTIGDTYSISGSGTARYGYASGPPCTGYPVTHPDGSRYLGAKNCGPKYDYGATLPNEPIGTLIWHVGSGHWVPASTSFTAAANGPLYLAYNDTPGEYKDNSGSYTATVRCSPSCGSPGPTQTPGASPSEPTAPTPTGSQIALPVGAWSPVGGAAITSRGHGVFEVSYSPTYWGGVIAHANVGCSYRFSGQGRVLDGGGYGFAVWASVDANGTPHGQSIQYDMGADGYRDVLLPDGSETGTVHSAAVDNDWHTVAVQVVNGNYTSSVDGQVIFTGRTATPCTDGLFIRLWNSTDAEFRNLRVAPIRTGSG